MKGAKMPKTVLVVEDERDIRESIINVLQFEEFETIEADNGRLAVRLAQKHLPDVIICDIQLSELDGYGVIMELGQQSNTADIPLIFLTALTNKEAIQKGLDLGASSYLTKPFSTSALLARVRDCLSNSC